MSKLLRKLIPFAALLFLTSCVNRNAATEKVDAQSVSFAVKEQYLELGETFKIKATVKPKNTTNKKLRWTTSDSDVAIVSEKGIVTPVSVGQATIKAAVEEKTSVYTTCDIYVVEEMIHPRSATLDLEEVTIKRGESTYLNATIYPLNSSNQTITWSTNNDNVFVDTHGRITGIHEGTSVVTAKTNDGNITATCNVTVTTSSIDQWTVLIYMCGANLESDYANQTTINYYGQTYEHDGIGLAVADLMEILAVPNQPDDVNIVIETGGANTWTRTEFANYGDYNISSSKLQRHHVENNRIVLDQELSTYQSMGLTSTLQSFVEYGLTTYPAQKTALILWNHGGGLQGACFDEKKSGDGLTPFELVDGVAGALSAVGRPNDKLEVIGYDCCLMQVQDIANINSQCFNYMVTSQETEAGTGWDYDSWVDDLYACKDTTQILKAIADGFINDNGGAGSSRNNQTLSYLNLRFMEEYRSSWEDLAAQLRNIVSNDNKESFNSFINKGKKYADDAYYAYGLFDAKNFIDRLETNTTFKVAGRYITAVKNAHKLLVEYSISGKGAGKSYGLSMFWNGYTFGNYWRSYTTYQYNEYSSSYGFPNWDYLNKNYGGTINA